MEDTYALIYASYGQNVHLSKWEAVNFSMTNFGVDDVLKVMDLILALSPTSVENERCFSQMKMVKRDRTLLKSKKIKYLSMDCLNGPSIE